MISLFFLDFYPSIVFIFVKREANVSAHKLAGRILSDPVF